MLEISCKPNELPNAFQCGRHNEYKPVTVKPDKMVGNGVMLIIRKDISGIPVVKNSKIVGIVTKSDIISEITNQ